MKILNHDENKDDFEQHSLHTNLKNSNSLLPKLTIPMFSPGKLFYFYILQAIVRVVAVVDRF